MQATCRREVAQRESLSQHLAPQRPTLSNSPRRHPVATLLESPSHPSGREAVSSAEYGEPSRRDDFSATLHKSCSRPPAGLSSCDHGSERCRERSTPYVVFRPGGTSPILLDCEAEPSSSASAERPPSAAISWENPPFLRRRPAVEPGASRAKELQIRPTSPVRTQVRLPDFDHSCFNRQRQP